MIGNLKWDCVKRELYKGPRQLAKVIYALASVLNSTRNHSRAVVDHEIEWCMYNERSQRPKVRETNMNRREKLARC